MQRVPDSLKELTARLVQQLRAKDRPPGRMATKKGSPAKPAARRKVGIWEACEEERGVAFVRPANSDPWRLWAEVDRIEPKGSKPRIVLLGESVARGFLLDPYFNCAIALRRMLEIATGDEIEVVDLAKCGQSFNDLHEDLPASLALEPDYYVIFAGNNWHIPYTEALLDFREVASRLEETGNWASVSRYIAGLVKKQIRGLVKWLGRFSAEHQVPIIFIIPEANLMDWEPNAAWQTPMATQDLMRRRLHFQREAEQALAAGDVNRAMALAGQQLAEPDEELNPLGFEIMAACKLALGELAEARRLKERARDIPLSLPVDRPPRCYTLIQEVLRHEAPLHGLALIDLPKRFQECFPGGLPDRRFFLDHCHMSVEGIRFAMACVTEELLGWMGKPEKAWPDLNALDIQIDQRGLAQAHVAAAFEYAVHHQKPALIKYHLAEAIRLEPGMVEMLHTLLDWHVRPYYHIQYITELENLLTKAGVYCLKFPLQTFVFHPDTKALYPVLVECLVDVLEATHPDIKATASRLLARELGVTADGIDLLNPCYMDLESAHLEHAGLVGQDEMRRIYLKSYTGETRFNLICAAPCNVRLSLTCRVPYAEAAKSSVRLIINGTVASVVEAGTDWRTWKIEIASPLMCEGMNSIVLQWPEQDQPKAERVSEVVGSLEAIGIWGNYKDLYRVYGEVHEFQAYAEGSAA